MLGVGQAADDRFVARRLWSGQITGENSLLIYIPLI